MTTYKGSGLPDNVDPDISTWTPEMFLLDEIGEVEKPSGEDVHRWGVAVPNAERPGRFHIVRHADAQRANAIAHGSPKVEVEWTHSGRRGKGLVAPIVWQHKGKGCWHFAATGWEVPR